MSKLQQSTIDGIWELFSRDYNLTDRRIASFIEDFAKQPGRRDWVYDVACSLSLLGENDLMEDLARVLGVDVSENGEVSRFDIMRKLKNVTPEQRSELTEMAAILKYEIDDAIKFYKPELREMVEAEQKRVGTHIPYTIHPKDLSKKEKALRCVFGVASKVFSPLANLKMRITKKSTVQSADQKSRARRGV